ncbi:SRPBCC family protein [Microbulbifer sp. VAAC004]|jgi:carbon monoxide dehydrogenase subunit G|uniref:SRPBCC family protein n=1 Tax=Microbulbifer variabilis TaxID=266805 RepID=A0ABY4VBA5_9GAMM|nr:SRPBCC family protein [Microbulbifer variabilis]USD21562.1 SRPBCC family protein [Microbulbifer variabilis]
MKIVQVKREVAIDRPIEEVWKVLAVDFDTAYQWMTLIPHSFAKEGTPVGNASVKGRVCVLTNKGPNGLVADETITRFDDKKHELDVSVETKNTPPGFPVKKSLSQFKLEALSENGTRVSFTANMELGAIGGVLSPVVKKMTGTQFGKMLEDLKNHLEKGRHLTGEAAA